MHKLLSRLLVAGTCGICTAVFAGPVVIVNVKNANKLTEQEVRDLYLGKTKSFPDGSTAVALALKTGPTRAAFVTDVLGKTDGQYKSFWASQVFTGKGQAPKEIESEEEMKKLIANNPAMVGFIDSGNVDASVKVVTK